MIQRPLLLAGAVLGLGLLLAACDNSVQVSPTAPIFGPPVNLSAVSVANAKLLVDGQSMNGEAMHRGHGEGRTALFRARLLRDGQPAVGYAMWVQYERPPAGEQNTGFFPLYSGLFQLYDDGTNGDQVAGDGTYSYRDTAGLYSCHRNNARIGTYNYDFFGVDHLGRRSLDVRVTVRVIE